MGQRRPQSWTPTMARGLAYGSLVIGLGFAGVLIWAYLDGYDLVWWAWIGVVLLGWNFLYYRFVPKIRLFDQKLEFHRGPIRLRRTVDRSDATNWTIEQGDVVGDKFVIETRSKSPLTIHLNAYGDEREQLRTRLEEFVDGKKSRVS